MRIIASDILIVISILFFLSCHIATNFLISYYQDVAESIKVDVEMIYNYEANPIARYILQFDNFKIIYSYVFAPGLVVSLYYLVRRNNHKHPENTMAFALMLLTVSFSNFLNDFSILLGIIL